MTVNPAGFQPNRTEPPSCAVLCVTSRWPMNLGEDCGIQLGRSCSAGDLGSNGRSCRRPDDQIGCSHIDPGVVQAGDQAELPGIACCSGAGEDEGSCA